MPNFVAFAAALLTTATCGNVHPQATTSARPPKHQAFVQHPGHKQHAPPAAPTRPAHLAPQPAHRPAHPPAPHPAARPAAQQDDVEEIEDVEAVQAADAGAPADGSAADANGNVQAQTGAGPRKLTDLLGHLHAAVVHLPIAWLALWSAFEALAILWRHPWLLMAGLPMSLVTTLSFAPAVLTGINRMNELQAASSAYEAAPALVHRNYLFVAWALGVFATGLRLTVSRPGRGFAARTLYVLLVWTAFAITAWSAHLGGCMVYGDDFLPF